MAVAMCSQESVLVPFCYLVTSQYRAYYRIRAATFEVDSSKKVKRGCQLSQVYWSPFRNIRVTCNVH